MAGGEFLISGGSFCLDASGNRIISDGAGDSACCDDDCYVCEADDKFKVWPKLAVTIAGISLAPFAIADGGGDEFELTLSTTSISGDVIADSMDPRGCIKAYFSDALASGTERQTEFPYGENELTFGLLITFGCDGTVEAEISAGTGNGVTTYSLFQAFSTWTPGGPPAQLGIVLTNENTGSFGDGASGARIIGGKGGTITITGQG